MSRITIVLGKEIRQALDELAASELRDVRQQATLIIRRELERRGLLLVDSTNEDRIPADEVSDEQ
jgi:hypothetical protein